MPDFEITLVCSDGQQTIEFVKRHMENFDEITPSDDHPFGIVGKISLKDYREAMRIINTLKDNAGNVIENISIRALDN
jgi:hypothetical protein